MSYLLPLYHCYANLPERFYTRTQPTPVRQPRMIRFNTALAEELGLDAAALNTPEGTAIFAGNVIPEDATPIAMAYGGHQFGHFVPQLGDGRAILLGEVKDKSGYLRDIHLKGAGQTPFSRRGDGRAALGPVVREYIISEAMHALEIPTTRTLAAVTTGEVVWRETPLPGAVLTRVAASHIRIGTFEYFATRGDAEALKILAYYCIERHCPALKDHSDPYVMLVKEVANSQAALIAKWLHVGFIHGVMNTDNITISGETIDYGPCAFMDAYNPATVFSSIDHHGRYAYGNQPHIAQWNIARLAEAIMVMVGDDNAAVKEQLQQVVDGFHRVFVGYWLAGMRSKLGLTTAQDSDIELINGFLEIMHTHADDYTNTLRSLHAVLQGQGMKPHYHEWIQIWQQRLAQESKPVQQAIALMKANNPAFIPRNHKVEEAISAAVNEGNFQPMDKLMQVLAKPFDEQSENAAFAQPAAPSEQEYKTFCGT